MKRIFTTLMIAGALMLNSNETQAQCYSAVQLDGVDDYLYSPFADYTFNTFTMEMWINSADYTPNEHYISLYQNSYIVLGGWGTGGVFDGWASGLNPVAIVTAASNTPTTGTWHHVAYVYDGTNQIFYVDGVAVVTTAVTGTVAANATFASGLVIGARYTQATQFSNTSFEDIRIWNVARTSAELNANMSSNLTGSESGLVAYYRFEDGQGSNTVTDLTGNGNTLTMNNMDPATDWISGPFGVAQSTDVQNSCGPITWIDGNTYSSDTNSVTYTYLGGSVGGCDSIVTLDLTINSAAQSTDVQTACDSYTWIDGNIYTANNNTAVYTMLGGAANGCDSIVTLDLTVNVAAQSTDIQTACDSYTWIDGITYTATTNTETYLVPGGAANGCDSTVTLDLVINTVDPTVTTSTFDLTANETGAQYQWVDCDNNFAPISGETSQTFTATANGSYAVIVTGANGCSDTSTCVVIATISVDETSLEAGIVLAPNPTNGEFSISTLNYSGEVRIEVLDVTGKLIFSSTENLGPNSSANIDLSEAANGVYIVNVSDMNEVHSMRVVKK
ncbi:MAG: T9SS type A sorting domain-containing protein [Crocinitomicaceae bacterium]|nr:T9SS type A sorting domain-containing protein [Flavobacteriales bacterium]NQZ35641.1 T9SS type A sorting domain-containing protein [Crocinitomicaceae bacterium]